MVSQKLSDVLPPLVFGTATFNYQFNLDPYALHPNDIVDRALAQGIRAFDTSPYYGPAEEILGEAIFRSTLSPTAKHAHVKRSDYFLLTKCGRISADTFDYSPEWIRHSIERSLKRFRTTYLDVVYCHDVEFVSPSEVLTAVQELRRIRDESATIKYVGICGYPVDTLCSLAEMILRETGEPLDIVQSYANFTLQNQLLLTHGLERLIRAGVDVVPNASPLGMGLLRRAGPPIGAMGNWHPAPDGLREACLRAAKWIEDQQSERLENVAVRFAMENWLREGAKVGSRGPLPHHLTSAPKSSTNLSYGSTSTSIPLHERFGVSVMGVSKISELDETLRIYHSVIDGFADPLEDGALNIQYNPHPAELTPSGDNVTDHEWSIQRRQRVRQFARAIRDIIGQEWIDYAWASPDPGFVNQRKMFGQIDDETERSLKSAATDVASSPTAPASHTGAEMPLTPPNEPDDNPMLDAVTEKQL